jgi:hypothetical protein
MIIGWLILRFWRSDIKALLVYFFYIWLGKNISLPIPLNPKSGDDNNDN